MKDNFGRLINRLDTSKKKIRELEKILIETPKTKAKRKIAMKNKE